MILVDTNIIIDFWNSHDKTLAKIFQKEEIAICGIVQAELLRGAKDQNEFEFMQECLSDLIFLSLDDSDWTEIGRLNYALKKNGISIPFQDATIALIAIKNNIPLLTRDKHFSLISNIFPNLKLMI